MLRCNSLRITTCLFNKSRSVTSPVLQDGNTEANLQDHQEKGLDGKYRLKRCLPPRNIEQGIKKIRKVYLGKEAVPVPSPSLRSLFKSLDLHEGPEARAQMGEAERNQIDSLSRRFASLGRLKRPVCPKRQPPPQKTGKCRLLDQGVKVIPNPKPSYRSLGDDYQQPRDVTEGPQGQEAGSQTGSREADQSRVSFPQKPGIIHWEGPVAFDCAAPGSSQAQAPSGGQDQGPQGTWRLECDSFSTSSS
ncbi:hypothetical protein AX774_g422, partial [Zancudomyces culisetae]